MHVYVHVVVTHNTITCKCILASTKCQPSAQSDLGQDTSTVYICKSLLNSHKDMSMHV